MELLLPVIVYYTSTQTTSILCLAGIGLTVLAKDKNRLGVLVLSLVLALHVLNSSPSPCLFPKYIKLIHGRVVSEPSRRGSRHVSYNLLVDSIGDDDGNVFSASGKLFVISSLTDVDYGDTVTLEGVVQDAYFLASSTEMHNRLPSGKGRRKFIPRLLASFPKGEVGNMAALLLTGSSLDGTRTIQEEAASVGLSYLFALSGMHLGLLALVLRRPLEGLGGKHMGYSFVLFLLTLFVYLNGWRPSLARALFFMVLSQFFGLNYGYLLSFLFMLVLFPLSILEVGTELSFLSLSGILFLSPYLKRLMDKAFPFFPLVESSLSASFGALAFTVPKIMEFFGGWNPISLVLAVPGGILLVFLFIAILGSIFIPKTEGIIRLLIEVFHRICSFGEVYQIVTDMRLYLTGLFLTLGIVGVSEFMRNRRRILDATRIFFRRILFLFT